MRESIQAICKSREIDDDSGSSTSCLAALLTRAAEAIRLSPAGAVRPWENESQRPHAQMSTTSQPSTSNALTRSPEHNQGGRPSTRRPLSQGVPAQQEGSAGLGGGSIVRGENEDYRQGTNLNMATRTLSRALRAVPGLRSTWWLTKSLLALAQDGDRPSKAAAWSENLFQNKRDPWGLEDSADHATRFREVGQMLDNVRNGRKFATAHEIACAEGTCTRKMLADRCERLLATDVSPTAVERARASCGGLSHIRFAVFDIMADPSPGVFELTLVMGFLEAFYHRRYLERAREKAVAMTAPNGYLLLSNTVWWAEEEFWWGRWLPHGAQWKDNFFAQHPQLHVVETMRAPWFLHTLFQKRG